MRQNATGKTDTWNIMELLSQSNLFDGSVQWLLHFGNCTPLEAHCHNLGDHFHNETALPRSYEVEPLVNSRPFEGLEHRILHSPAFASIESQDLRQERGVHKVSKAVSS